MVFRPITRWIPTWFVALTYSFIFGAMFGDVGQGLLLFIGGFLLYKFKHITLAGIISCAGVFSTIFGFMFGSIFGFEDVIPALWLRPMNNMMSVPFIGKLNTVFIVAIGFGMCLILLCMVFNILNAWKAGDSRTHLVRYKLRCRSGILRLCSCFHCTDPEWQKHFPAESYCLSCSAYR